MFAERAHAAGSNVDGPVGSQNTAMPLKHLHHTIYLCSAGRLGRETVSVSRCSQSLLAVPVCTSYPEPANKPCLFMPKARFPPTSFQRRRWGKTCTVTKASLCNSDAYIHATVEMLGEENKDCCSCRLFGSLNRTRHRMPSFVGVGLLHERMPVLLEATS